MIPLLLTLWLQTAAPAPTTDARIAVLERHVETLTDKIEYLRDLLEQLAGRVTVLEARVIPTTCVATLARVPVSCKLQ